MTKPKTNVTPHLLQPDPDTPGDPITGDQVCAHCHLVVKPGDARHTMPDPVPDVQSLRAGDEN